MRLAFAVVALATTIHAATAHAQLAPPAIVLLNGTGTVSDVVRNVDEIVTAAPESGDRTVFFASVVSNRGSVDVGSKLFRIDTVAMRVSDHSAVSVDVFGLQGVAGSINDTIMLGAPFAAPRTQEMRTLEGRVTLQPTLGSAGDQPGHFACHRNGECVLVQLRSPNVGAVARRFVPAAGPAMTGTPPLDVTFGVGVPIASSFDVAFFNGRLLIVWHEGATSPQHVFGQWLPPMAAVGAPMPGVMSFGPGRFPRVTCNEMLGGCVIGYLAEDGVHSFATSAIQSGNQTTAVSAYPAGTTFLSIDLTPIRSGIRVGALIQLSGPNFALGAADFVGVGGVVNTSQSLSFLPARPPRDLRLETSTNSDVSVATWVAGATAIAQGAVIMPPPPDGGADASSEAGPDASADGAAQPDGEAQDATATADSSISPDGSAIDPGLRYTGGACACGAAHTHSRSSGGALPFAGLALLAAMATVRRRSNED